MADYEKEESEKPTKTDDEKILEEARKHLNECIDEESSERAKMKDDLRFCTLDQWPVEIRTDRERDIENGSRPCLTIDKINQYIVQVVNDMRQGKPGINVRPQDDAADVETAKILKGLVRNIEDQSNADIPYSVAGENATKIGLGYFRITTEYVSDESFDQELFIRPIPNTFCVYLGKHLMPDGSDAEHGFIIETMPLETFRETFPKAKAEAKDFEGLDSETAGHWKTTETITVVEYFCIKRTTQELVFLADGTSISRQDYEKWPEDLAGPRPAEQDSRTTVKKQLKWYKMTAVEVLEKRDLPGKYIPIVEVVGREAWVDGKRVLWGLVRPAKDSLRFDNYCASAIAEKIMLAPKTPFIGAKGQFEGIEERWKKANRVNYSYLEYNAIDVNGNAIPAPQRQPAMPIEMALIQQRQIIAQDVRAALGIFKAGVGESESQQSGRAILALQRESDTGTYHFGANLGVSIRHAGRILVDLIPHYYDTRRIVRILGEDGEVQTAQIDPEQPEAMREIRGQDGAIKRIYNPGVGKYDVSITVGPSYNTKRMEAAATFVELAKGSADPASAMVLRYLTVLNSDFAGADRAAKMLKALLPPQVADEEPIPPKAMAEMQKMAQGMQAMREAGSKLQQENVQLKAGVAEAQINAQAEERISAMHLQAEARMEAIRLQMEQRDEAARRMLEEREARRDAEFERWKALLEARTDVVVARINAENKPEPARTQ